MRNIKNFDQWLKEDFAVPGSVVGMGDPVAPTSSLTGSGDQWPSLGGPWSLMKIERRKRRKKNRKKR